MRLLLRLRPRPRLRAGTLLLGGTLILSSIAACRGEAEPQSTPRSQPESHDPVAEQTTRGEEAHMETRRSSGGPFPFSFEVPLDLVEVAFETEAGSQLFFVPRSEAAEAKDPPSANSRAVIRGSASEDSPPSDLPGRARSAHGVDYCLYPALTPEGAPSDWFVVVPTETGMVSFQSAAAESTVLRRLAESLQRK